MSIEINNDEMSIKAQQNKRNPEMVNLYLFGLWLLLSKAEVEALHDILTEILEAV